MTPPRRQGKWIANIADGLIAWRRSHIGLQARGRSGGNIGDSTLSWRDTRQVNNVVVAPVMIEVSYLDIRHPQIAQQMNGLSPSTLPAPHFEAVRHPAASLPMTP
jgi:hypothetical protein